MSDIGLFEAIHTMRAMRRLRPDPVPVELIRKVLDAGTRAPSAQNAQPWEFVVVRDTGAKRFLREHYYGVMTSRLGKLRPDPADRSPRARLVRASFHLGEHLHEAPVLLLACGRREWPGAVPPEHRIGKAPPSYNSIYPCVQNILLTCRGLGLGASLTTLHQFFEDELHDRFGIPEEFGVVALIPIGFPAGRFGPVTRIPAEQKTHFDHWERREP